MLNKKKALTLSTIQNFDDVEYMEASYQNDGVIQYCTTNYYFDWSKDFKIKGTIARTGDHASIICGPYSGAYTFNIAITTAYRLRCYISAVSAVSLPATDIILTGTLPTNEPVMFEFSWTASTGDYSLSAKSLSGGYSDTKTGTIDTRTGIAARPSYIFVDSPRITNPSSAYNGNIRIYQLEFIEAGTSVAKYLPKVRNGIPYMYDEVNRLCLFNQGGGTFSTGRKVREVEYITLDGTQYFNTKFSANTLSTTAKGKFSIDNTYAYMEGSRLIAGDYPKSASFYMPTKNSSYPYSRFRMDWISAESFFSNALTSNVHEFEITGNYAKIDGVEYTDTTKTSVDMTNTYYIGACKTGTSSSLNYPLHGNIYYRQLLNTTTRELYRDYIPAIDENGVGFLFDRVNHIVYLPEAGTITQYGRRIIPVKTIKNPTKAAYINTGVYPKLDTIKVQTKAIKDTGYSLFGTYDSSHNGVFNLTGVAPYNNYLRYGSGTNVGYAVTNAALPHLFVAEQASLYVDGDFKGTQTTVTNTSTYPIALFGRTTNAAGTSVADVGNNTFYYCKIWNEGSLVRDYIPARDENDIAFMFDKATHTIYDKIGSGKFKYERLPNWIDGIYEQLEWLESTGTQYITVVSGQVDQTYGIKMTMSMTAETDNYPAGSTGLSGNRILFFGARSGTSYWSYGWATTLTGSTLPKYPFSSYPAGINNFYTATLNFLNSKKVSFENETPETMSDSTKTFTNTNIKLFGSYTTPYCKSRIKEAFISKGTDLIRHLIPVRRITDGVLGMYDKVNKVFYTNDGTGSFIAGDVL